MDTATLTVTDSRLHHAAAADSAARHRSPAGGRGLGSLAARAAESLARGLVTCVFAAGQSPSFFLQGKYGMARESATLRACSALLQIPDRFVGCWAVGTVLGAITGGLIGLATETGVVRGTGVGGLTGALVSMEVVESYLAMWRSDEPAIWSAVYVVSACSARFLLAWLRRHGPMVSVQRRKFAGIAALPSSRAVPY
jgi:hypothetical protein